MSTKTLGEPVDDLPTTLPAGILTFVLTDMEGSTRLFQTLGYADYQPLLRDHHHLLHSAFAARGGVRVDVRGDSCLAVFTRATDALAASLDAQFALLAQRWPRYARVRVRMGLHTGEARPVGDHYVALALHQADRIMTAAHGGQVLVSDITRQLAATDLPAGVELAALGEYRLKDVKAPQSIFQLCHPRLPVEFPPLRALKVPSLVSRYREIAEAERPLAATCSLRVAGPGEAGKIRLILELEARLLQDRPDEVSSRSGFEPAALNGCQPTHPAAGSKLASLLIRAL